VSGPVLLADPRALLAAFTSLCDWAEEITVCTPRVDDGEGWRALARNAHKVRLCLVSDRAPGLEALAPLRDKGALRLFADHESGYRPNVYLFRRGVEARALVGSARLAGDGAGSGVESVVRVDGTRDDPFACSLADFVEACLARSRLPGPDGLTAAGLSSVGPGSRLEVTCPSRYAEPACDAGVAQLLPVRDAGAVRSAQLALWSVVLQGGIRLRVEVGRKPASAFWHPGFDFWAARLKGHGRLWTVFGTGNPRVRKRPVLTLALSIPEEGHDAGSSGAFAVEPGGGSLFLVHRGGFRGGGRGRKRLFWKTTRLRGSELLVDGHVTRVALVADLNSRVALEQVAAYVREVERVRVTVRRPADGGTLGDPPGGRVREQFTDIAGPDERASVVWQRLLGLGVLSKGDAVRKVAHGLREDGRADFRRLDSSGPLYIAVLDAIERGVRFGLLDRPGRGLVRAVLAEARDYPDRLWRRCILASLGGAFVSREEAVRRAASWAVENLGLRHHHPRTGGRVDEGLRRALDVVIRRGRVVRQGPDLVRLGDEI